MDQMRKGFELSLLVLLVLLCACGKTTETAAPSEMENVAEEVTASQTTPQSTVQTVNTPVLEETPVNEMPRLTSEKIPIDEHVVVELPEDVEPDKTMVYREQGSEATVIYQDVSEHENVLAIPAAYGSIGETITVTPGIYGQVELCAMDLRFSYDSSQLKFLGYEAENDETLLLNGEERGVIYANYLLIENATEGFDLCQLQFQILTADACDSVIDVEVVEMVALNEENIVASNYSVIPGLVHLNSANE